MYTAIVIHTYICMSLFTATDNGSNSSREMNLKRVNDRLMNCISLQFVQLPVSLTAPSIL